MYNPVAAKILRDPLYLWFRMLYHPRYHDNSLLINSIQYNIGLNSKIMLTPRRNIPVDRNHRIQEPEPILFISEYADIMQRMYPGLTPYDLLKP